MIRAAKRPGYPYLVLDGTLIPIDRVAADRPYYSIKHKKYGMNIQVSWPLLMAHSCGSPAPYQARYTTSKPPDLGHRVPPTGGRLVTLADKGLIDRLAATGSVLRVTDPHDTSPTGLAATSRSRRSHQWPASDHVSSATGKRQSELPDFWPRGAALLCEFTRAGELVRAARPDGPRLTVQPESEFR